MKHSSTRRLGAAVLGLGLAAAATGLAAPAATAAPASKAGTTSLAEVLAADGKKLDNNWKDFDIVEAAVYAVLEAKPDSPVGLLADGDTRLTAFIPTDSAFRVLVKDLTGKAPKSEAGALKKTVAAAGSIDVVEAILLYHVVAGQTLTSPKVLAADGQALTTAQGGTVTVNVNGSTVRLVDQDPDDGNPKVKVLDINRGNKQVAHGINRVLRPVNL